jgi:hypothetical protein
VREDAEWNDSTRERFDDHVVRTITRFLDLIVLCCINPLNAELNPICHLLILLGYLTFMGPYIVSIFQYISNKMQRYTVYLYLEAALHISGGTSTRHQERIQLYSIWYLSHRYCYLPLSWKNWNRFECAVGGVRNPQHTQTSTTMLETCRGF